MNFLEETEELFQIQQFLSWGNLLLFFHLNKVANLKLRTTETFKRKILILSSYRGKSMYLIEIRTPVQKSKCVYCHFAAQTSVC